MKAGSENSPIKAVPFIFLLYKLIDESQLTNLFESMDTVVGPSAW